MDRVDPLDQAAAVKAQSDAIDGEGNNPPVNPINPKIALAVILSLGLVIAAAGVVAYKRDMLPSLAKKPTAVVITSPQPTFIPEAPPLKTSHFKAGPWV